jgi:hypothetical protein
MDGNLLALIAIGFVVIVAGLAGFRRWARVKMRQTAETRKVTAVPEMLSEFGRSVVLQTDPAATIALVEALPKRKAKTMRPGVWGINYISKDDVVIEVRELDGASEVLVTSLHEHFGFPHGLSTWQSFADQLEKAAATSGIVTRRGAHTLQLRPAPAGTIEDAHWVLVD